MRSHVRRCVNGIAGDEGCEEPAMEIESCNNQVKGMLYINIDIFEYFYVVNNYFKHLQHCIFKL